MYVVSQQQMGSTSCSCATHWLVSVQSNAPTYTAPNSNFIRLLGNISCMPLLTYIMMSLEEVHEYCSQSVSSMQLGSECALVSPVLYQNRTVQSCSCICASCSCKTLCFTLSRLLGITLCMPSLITQRRDPFMLHPVSSLRCSLQVCVVEENNMLPQPIPEGVVQHSSLNKR